MVNSITISDDVLSLIIVFAVSCYVVLSKISYHFGLDKLLYKKQQLDIRTSLLLSFYTNGNFLLNVSSGELGDISFKCYMTMPGYGVGSNSSIMDGWAIIYAIELDFNTQAHIIGLGKEAKLDSLKLRSHFNSYEVERVNLEGDFNNYFDLYASSNQQTKARYIFDPAAMQSYIKYCRYNFWEIVGDEMYFVISSNHDNSSPVIQNAHEFVRQIKPALIRTFPDEDPVYHEPSYGKFHKIPLLCPLCESSMTIEKNVSICPQGHGVLLFGAEVIKLRHKKLIINIPNISVLKHSELTCPKCKKLMSSNIYMGTKVYIDTCSGCALRWLDSDELIKIQTKTAYS